GRAVTAADVKKSFELIVANLPSYEANTYYFFVLGAIDAQKQAAKVTKPGDVAQPQDIPGFVAKSDLELEMRLTAPAPALIPFLAAGSFSGWAIGDPEQMMKDTPEKRWN